MAWSLSFSLDTGDSSDLGEFMNGIVRRASRKMILPILERHMQTLVEAEKGYLSDHVKSGALIQSLQARVTGGRADRPGTMTAFSSPSANRSLLEATWRGKTARKQQRGWKLPESKRRRARVFYADIVHQGHPIVRRDAEGRLRVVGKADPIPFAFRAVAEKGEAELEAAATEILDLILGGGE